MSHNSPEIFGNSILKPSPISQTGTWPIPNEELRELLSPHARANSHMLPDEIEAEASPFDGAWYSIECAGGTTSISICSQEERWATIEISDHSIDYSLDTILQIFSDPGFENFARGLFRQLQERLGLRSLQNSKRLRIAATMQQARARICQTDELAEEPIRESSGENTERRPSFFEKAMAHNLQLAWQRLNLQSSTVH